MADMDDRAFLAQAQDIGVLRGVGALHGVAEIEQHLGDAGHADAADADEMNGAEFLRKLHRLSFFLSFGRVFFRNHAEHEVGEPVGGVGDP